MVKFQGKMDLYFCLFLILAFVEKLFVEGAIIGGNCTLPDIQNGLFLHLNADEPKIIRPNEIVYASCNKGYSLDGSPEIICRNGLWTPNLPVCQPKKCSVVSIPNGIITSNSSSTEPISHKTYIYIKCSPGFLLDGTSSLFCNFGKWSSEIPSCVPMHCQPDDVDNGILIHEGVVVQSSKKIPHEDTIMVSCINGYTVSTDFSHLTCQFGKWSSPFPSCEPEPCVPHKVPNGRVFYSGQDISAETKVHDSHTATVICGSDYILHGENALTCSKGVWSHDFPSCLPKFCSSQLVAQGEVLYFGKELQKETNIEHRSSVYISCKPGYVNIGSTKVTCSYGHWSQNFPTCVPSSCHAQTVLHGMVKYLEQKLINVCSTLSDGLVSHSHVVSIKCLEGFKLQGTDILTCKFGNWSDKFPECHPAKCDTEAVENGKVVDEEGTEIRTAVHSQQVLILCNNGYRLPRENAASMIKCYYGEWTYPFPACVPENCSANAVLNGQVSYNDSVVEFNMLDPKPLQVPHKQYVEVSCMNGFSTTDRTKVMCVSGKWLQRFPTCYPNSCQAYTVANGITHIIEQNSVLKEWGQLVPHGLSVNITCKIGHELSGPSNLKCLYGNWTGDFPECTPKSCPAIKVKNGKESYVDDEATSFVKHDMFLHISCDEGYQLDGASKIKCSQGFWCSPSPKCEPKQCLVKEVTGGTIQVNGKQLVVYDKPVDHLSIAVMKCHRSFVVNGIPKVQCLFGKWSSEFPTCNELGCQKLRNSKYMTVSVDVVEGIEEMTIACNEGTHEPADNITNVICLQNKWVPFIPKCRPNPCKVPELNNGHYHSSLLGRIQSGTEMEHGQTIYAKCENGYETTKFYFTSCKYGEFKNIENISCVEKSCKSLKKITNGTFDEIENGEQLSWIPGTKTKVICENGFIPKNGITNVTCQRGRWQPDEPSCIPKSCLLPFIPNGYFLYRNHKQIQDKLIKNGTAIKTFCDSNHNLSGPKTIVCTYGKWLPKVPVCQKYSCIPLTNSTTSPLVLLQDTHHRKDQEIGSVSLFQDQLHPHGTVVKLACDPSKYKSKNGVTTSTCLNGKWTVTDLECQPFSCLQLKNDSVSSPLTLIGSTSRLMLHSSTVELHCNPQTTIPLNNNIRSVCQYGKWIPSLLECKPRPCVLPEFKETSYRFLNDEPVVNFTIPSGTYIHVICEKPHLIPTVVLCHYGKWVLPVRSCFDGSCYISQSENIDFWTDTGSGEINFKNYVHNSTSIKISCKLNSRLLNGTVNKFTCLEGEWSPHEPFCEKKPVKAPKLLRTNPICKHPEQGDNVVFVWDNVDSRYKGNSFIANGTSFHARCTDVGNFQLLGSNFLSCQNGIWYGKLPVCQKTEEDESAPPRIYINITTTWSDERIRYVVTANGSVVINAGDRLQLGCSHNLYETKDLEWVPPNDSIPVPESIPETIASNVTGVRLHIPHFTPNNVGRYICRIKNSSLFHFVKIIIL